jgi:hypothetical protein
MGVTKVGNVAAQHILDSVSNATVEQITTTTAVTFYGGEIDNRDNKVASTTRFWFKASSPTVGTHDPQFVIKTPAGVRQPFQLGGAALSGVALGVGLLLYANTTTLSGSPSQVSPAKDVRLSTHVSAV